MDEKRRFLAETSPKLLKRFERMYAEREKAEKRVIAAEQAYEKMRNSDISRKEIKLQREINKVMLLSNNLNRIDEQLKYLRPGRNDDVSYRLKQYRDFHEKIASVVPDNLPLRFHGCPIYAAEKIIKSGEISSSVDRLGVETSYDGAGQISVTTKDNLYITTQGYMNLTEDMDLPAGCVFVLTPKDKADELSGEQLMMDNVDFKSDSRRLVAVISTPENIKEIKNWFEGEGLSTDKVYDFDGFIGSIHRIIDSVDIPYSKVYSKANIGKASATLSASQAAVGNNRPNLSSLVSIAQQRSMNQPSLGYTRSIPINKGPER